MQSIIKNPLLRKASKALWDFFYNIIIILFIVVIVRSFIVSPFHVSGSSMTSTLHNNDYIIIDKLSYLFETPGFEDIIVFTPPNPRIRKVGGLQCIIAKASAFNFDENSCQLPDFFIKRIIGVGGDIITIRDGEVYRNGKILDEVYLNEDNNHKTFVPDKTGERSYIVPDDYYFVMGDNRNGSSDSRAHSREWQDPDTGAQMSFIHKDSIEGRYFFTLLSPYALEQLMLR